VRRSCSACGSDVRLSGSAAVSGKQYGSVRQWARLCCAEVHVPVCGGASGGVRSRLKLSGSLSTAVCSGAALCISMRGFVRQCADVCGSTHGSV
jgi:hypothetical protein